MANGSTQELAKQLTALKVSRPYASQIANGIRQPSLKLALQIFDGIGVKLGPIKKATDEEIQQIKGVRRFVTKPKRARAAA